MRALVMVVLLSVGCHKAAPRGGQTGDACLQDSDCKQAGASCVTEAVVSKWVGGYCLVRNCPETPCPAGTYCQRGGTSLGTSTCLKTCASTADCRDGYRCCPTTHPAGGMVCAPPKAGKLCP